MGDIVTDTNAKLENNPVSLVVTVEIFEDRIPEFLQLMEANSIASRTTESGCLTFDVAQDLVNPSKFVFYEVYATEEDLLFHKTTPHYANWAKFKESGGIKNVDVIKAAIIFHNFRK
jgi:quinol monooxygenase YgiN